MAAALQVDTIPAPASNRRRILVVDDNVDAALMLAEALKYDGHDVMTAFDGPTALATAEQFHPDAALLDLGLPVMDGFELARRLRELPGGAPMKIVAVTGYSSAKDRERSAQASFDSHLVKPIDTNALESLFTDLFAAG
jgi:CheY-like chemotaxis protein